MKLRRAGSTLETSFQDDSDGSAFAASGPVMTCLVWGTHTASLLGFSVLGVFGLSCI